VNAQEIITSWDFEGNGGGCAGYASLLVDKASTIKLSA